MREGERACVRDSVQFSSLGQPLLADVLDFVGAPLLLVAHEVLEEATRTIHCQLARVHLRLVRDVSVSATIALDLSKRRGERSTSVYWPRYLYP